MNKRILIFFFTLINSTIYAQEKPVSFLTSVGKTYTQANVQSHNTAYMNGLKVIEKRVVKNGDIWVITVKTVPRY